MIRRALYYLICVTGYILLTAKGCEPEMPPVPAEKETHVALIRKWEATFDTAFLSEERRLALTEQGNRKLIDFFDYLHLISDKQLDPAFRNQALSTATHLFATSQVLIDLPLASNETDVQKSLLLFFRALEHTGYTSVNYVLSEPVPAQQLSFVNDTLYAGMVKGGLLVKGISATDSATIFSGTVQAEIRAIRTAKSFGNKKTRHVWQVFLGNIRAGK